MMAGKIKQYKQFDKLQENIQNLEILDVFLEKYEVWGIFNICHYWQNKSYLKQQFSKSIHKVQVLLPRGVIILLIPPNLIARVIS